MNFPDLRRITSAQDVTMPEFILAASRFDSRPVDLTGRLRAWAPFSVIRLPCPQRSMFNVQCSPSHLPTSKFSLSADSAQTAQFLHPERRQVAWIKKRKINGSTRKREQGAGLLGR